MQIIANYAHQGDDRSVVFKIIDTMLTKNQNTKRSLKTFSRKTWLRYKQKNRAAPAFCFILLPVCNTGSVTSDIANAAQRSELIFSLSEELYLLNEFSFNIIAIEHFNKIQTNCIFRKIQIYNLSESMKFLQNLT